VLLRLLCRSILFCSEAATRECFPMGKTFPFQVRSRLFFIDAQKKKGCFRGDGRQPFGASTAGLRGDGGRGAGISQLGEGRGCSCGNASRKKEGLRRATGVALVPSPPVSGIIPGEGVPAAPRNQNCGSLPDGHRAKKKGCQWQPSDQDHANSQG
jgi:hypothetical protein